MYVVLDAGINGEVERQLGVLLGAGGFGGNLGSLSRLSGRGRDFFPLWLLGLAVLGVLCSLLLCQERLAVLRGEGEEMVVADSLAFGVDDDREDAMEHHVCLDCREILLVSCRSHASG